MNRKPTRTYIPEGDLASSQERTLTTPATSPPGRSGHKTDLPEFPITAAVPSVHERPIYPIYTTFIVLRTGEDGRPGSKGWLVKVRVRVCCMVESVAAVVPRKIDHAKSARKTDTVGKSVRATSPK